LVFLKSLLVPVHRLIMIRPLVFGFALFLLAGFPITAGETAPKTLDAWQPAKGWREAGSVALDPADSGKLLSTDGPGILIADGKADYLPGKQPHRDAEIHVEFNIPARSNSGVYVMGSYEVQIYDSHGVAKDQYPGIECGGIYPEWVRNANVRGHSPAVNASLPPGVWQSFDIVFRAPRFDASGRKTANARFEKVLHNGKTVHENVEVPGPTRGGLPEAAAGPLRLQGDHGVVAFRNIRIKPLDSGFSWNQSPTSLALLNCGKTVWQLVFDPKEPKSYFHPLATVDGTAACGFRGN
jgi:Domain of Unknown Function (DUF1080)